MSAILLDLDGTIIDSAPGIIASYQYAMRAYGLEAPPAEAMRWVVGPPARQTMPRLIGPDHDVERAVALYRGHYVEHRLFDAIVYPGMREALAELREDGARLFVCTAKPIGFAERIMAGFELNALFEGVYGADLEGRFDDKGLLIAHILAERGVSATEAVMVGDRANDMRAAARHAMPAVGALWGYGDAEELTGTGATVLCPTPRDLPPAIRSLAAAAPRGVASSRVRGA